MTEPSKRPFQHTLNVQPSDIDELGHVNNVVYVRWVQEVAAAHWSAVASEPLRQRYAWVVLRHEIDYRHPAFLQDTIVGETWVGHHQGARFERFVRLSNAQGKILAEARTDWCLLDAVTFRPVRIPEEILQLL